MFVDSLKYQDLLPFAEALSDQDHLVWLDSPQGQSYSLIAFGPQTVKTFFCASDRQDFETFLQSFEPQGQKALTTYQNLWLGYMAYEAFVFNPLIPLKPHAYKNYPLACFAQFTSFIVQNHQNKTCQFISHSPDAEKIFKDLKAQQNKVFAKTAAEVPKFSIAPIKATVTQKQYAQKFHTVKQALQNGDYFELNLTQEFSAKFSGQAFSLYKKLRRISQAPMMSYLRFPQLEILSASPERFFQLQNQSLTTHPIKGTRHRGQTQNEDEALIQDLQTNPKDNAELLMVTDLMRNDLGRVCQTGSIRVEELNRLHSFSHYHHLIAKISGRLRPNTSFYDIFTSLFPGGSITGAPKIQVMQHIDELEDHARGVYTGAIGCLSDGFMDFSIPIRTMVHHQGKIEFATGGGLVIDSDCDEEFKECLIKASALFEALKG